MSDLDDKLNAGDLAVWVGKPPEKPIAENSSGLGDDSESGGSNQTQSPSPLGSSGDVVEIAYDENNAAVKSSSTGGTLENLSDESEESLQEVIPSFQTRLYIQVPKIDARKENEYKYLPGHFSARRILSECKGGRYFVRLESGETDILSAKQVRNLKHGQAVLNDYNSDTMLSRGKREQRKLVNPQMIDWTTLGMSDSDQEPSTTSHRRKRPRTDDGEEEAAEPESDIEVSDDDDDDDDDEGALSDMTHPTGRRSSRLTSKRPANYFRTEVDDLASDSDDVQSTIRRSTRTRRGPQKSGHQSLRDSTRTQRHPRAGQDHSSPELDLPIRRSERTLTKPHRDMRERQEDEIFAHSEDDIGPRVVGAKESFIKIPEADPFRKRHRQDCDTCNFEGDSDHKGPLVFCQGCTNSHHKSCLGPRGSRDHLVTKIGENNFVLQCRRCIGTAHAKDPTAPHHGVCAGCDESGLLSKPFRSRLTTKEEQNLREDNGGRDPITIVDPEIIGQTANVMFRCTTCQRVWHMHHLPNRKTAHSLPEDEEEDQLDENQLAQKRFELYHRSWVCKDCIEHQSQIDVLVAWRPVNIDSYTPGVTGERVEESQKEYLVKWKAQSYLRTTWMPGSWVWGIAATAMRTAFLKKQENRLPRLTTADAMPEDFFRVDIVFDVQYSSVVRDSTMEIDLARVSEVDKAFVKYRGLGYEDAIWETPPSFADTDRWNDFQDSYEDYVAKLHVCIPPQTTLRRHLLAVRTQDFESTLMRKIQPENVTGGQIMQYQMEGLNWLYFQWFQSQNAILADEMGLGKTIQLIAFFALMVQEHKCWPFLVVVPNSTCPNWRREIKKWAPSLRVVTYYGSATARKLTHDYELFPKIKDTMDANQRSHQKRSEVKDINAHIVVASYESIVEEKTRKSLIRVPWQGLVVDEGQRLKSDKNLVYEALSKIRFPFKVLLTGTPLQNNVRELFNLLQFLDRSLNAAELEAKYATLTQENVPELHEQLRKFFLRRTKAQVLTFLPPMAQIIIPVTMSTVQKKVYKSILAKNPQLMKSIFSRDGPVAGKERPNLNNILMQLRKTLCHPFVYSRDIEERTHEIAVSHRNLVEASAKLQLLQIMLPKLQERGHRVLLFSQFLDNLDVVEDFLDGLGLLHRRLDGQINASEKQKRIDDFNAPGSPYFAFLLSTRAGGVGINLATADTVIILDPDFNPHQDIQALSRAHRIGQKHKVLVFQLMTRGSAEEKIMQIGKKKMALDHVLIESMDQDDDAGIDLESILRHGAEALFDDDANDEIVYDSTSVDRLLDRSQIEDTKVSDDKSAESQFSFARIWANDKSVFEEGLKEVSGTSTPNPGIWDKILEERERAYAEEAVRKAETLGRGKRKRQNVDYGRHDAFDADVTISPFKGTGKSDDDGSDTDFQLRGDPETEDNITEDEAAEGELPDAEPKRPTVKARPFKRVKVPSGPASHFAYDGAADYMPMGDLPPAHRCSACDEVHPMGWCRLKIAGVEHCGLCGLAHLGHGRACPHLSSEAQVVTLLQTLKESTESRELIDLATRHLRMIRGDLVSRKRAAEQKRLELEAQAPTNARGVGGGNYHIGGFSDGVDGFAGHQPA